jgi:hypothetical protein
VTAVLEALHRAERFLGPEDPVDFDHRMTEGLEASLRAAYVVADFGPVG